MVVEVSLGEVAAQHLRFGSLAEILLVRGFEYDMFGNCGIWSGGLPNAKNYLGNVITDFVLQSYEGPGAIPQRSLPQQLRDETCLQIDVLAKLSRVSRQRFHQWLRGEGIRPENEERLAALLVTLRAIAALRPKLSQFLLMRTPLGTPLDLLAGGADDTVLGLARFSELVSTRSGFKRLLDVPRRVLDGRSSVYDYYNSTAAIDDANNIADDEEAVIPLGILSIEP